MKNKHRILFVLLVSTTLSACSLFDRSDRLREFEIGAGKVGINITDTTRRIAVIYPDSRICSELSPPAILEIDKTLAGNVKAPISGVSMEGGGSYGNKTTAVKLTTSTEAIECIRISLFNAYGLAANNKLTSAQEIELFKDIIQQCLTMNPAK